MTVAGKRLIAAAKEVQAMARKPTSTKPGGKVEARRVSADEFGSVRIRSKAKVARKFVLRVMVTTDQPKTRTQARLMVESVFADVDLDFRGIKSARVTNADVP